MVAKKNEENADKEIEKNEEKTFDAIARRFIKYGGEYIEDGEKFQVKESDIEELKQYADIKIPEVQQEGEGDK